MLIRHAIVYLCIIGIIRPMLDLNTESTIATSVVHARPVAGIWLVVGHQIICWGTDFLL